MEIQENEKLWEALRYLWELRKRHDPTFVYIDYTTRRKVRGILGRELSNKLDGVKPLNRK